jgi:hypothetical protein
MTASELALILALTGFSGFKINQSKEWYKFIFAYKSYKDCGLQP